MRQDQIFSGVKVLELASVLAGPSVGQFFAELGAEVIKVENPKTKGDVTRTWKGAGETSGDISAYFSCVNWGKQSLALDYSQEKGLCLLHKLIEICDIIIVSFKPGDAKKLNLTYEKVKFINPEILYGAVTGFGKDDTRAGYDAVVQAESGFMSINGQMNAPPLKLPVALMDILAAHHLKEALLLAYIQKLKTGEGQEVTVSLIDAAMASLANQGASWLVAGQNPKPMGSLHPNIAPYGEIFPTADGKQIILAIGTDRQFLGLCKSLELSAGPEFHTNHLRVQNREALFILLKEAIAPKTSEELLNMLREQNIPCGIVNSIAKAIEQYNQMLVKAGSLAGIRTFAGKMDKLEKLPHFLPPPHYSQHTQAILKAKLGLSAAEIADFRATGLIH